MRNPQEDRRDAVMESLEACGLSKEQLERAEKYLNGEVKECNLGMDRLLVYVNRSSASRDQMIDKCIERLGKHKETELEIRYFRLLFQIFGVSLSPLYFRMYGIKKEIPADLRIALEAVGYEGSPYFSRGGYQELLKISSDREVIRKAYSHVEGREGIAAFSILTALFYGGMNAKPWNGKAIGNSGQENKGLIGLLGSLLGSDASNGEENGFESNDYVKKYPREFQKYLELFPILACRMEGAVSKPGMENHIRQFLMDKNVKNPIPREILDFGATITLKDSRSQTVINMAGANYRLSPVIYQFLRIFAAIHLEETLEALYASTCRSDMLTEVMRWRADLVADDTRFILWLARKRSQQIQVNSVQIKALGKMTGLNPDAYVQALRAANPDSFNILSNAAQNSGNTSFIQGKLQPLINLQSAKFRQDTMEKIMPSGDAVLRSDVSDFLSGKKGIEVLYPHESKLVSSGGYGNLSMPLMNYDAVYGRDDFYERALAYLGFRCMEYTIMPFCCDGGSYQINMSLVPKVLDVMGKGGLDVARKLNVAAMILESYRGNYQEKKKELIKYFSRELISDKQEAVTAFQNAPVSGRIIGVAVLGGNPQGNKDALFAFISETSKQVKEELVQIFAGQESWMEDFLTILRTSKKSAEREMAAAVLAKYKRIKEHQDELRDLMEKEKSKKVVELIKEILRACGSLGEDAATEVGQDAGDGQKVVTPESYVKECHKGGKKRGLAWIYEQPMPEVHCLEGTEEGKERCVVSEEYLQAILLSYSAMLNVGVNQEVHILTDRLDKLELAAYMDVVYERFLAQGAEAKKKWVLYATAIHGGAKIVPKFQHQINEWAESSRGAMAAEAVKALTLNDSPTALLIVDSIARKYKFKQVRKAAGDAMAFAAAQLGLTVEELADRIVPDLGFDEKMERRFDYGSRSFTVRISPSLDMEVKDENGKKIKSLPAVGKNDDEAKAKAALEEFKELKKQMKTTVKNQALRLDLAMSLDRKWTVENWKKLFVMNPIMHQFAISLIWGYYQEDKLSTTFRYMEDGTFNTVDEEEYELSDGGKVGLVHPIELDKETIDAWKEQLSDYEITQAVEQLDRQVFTVLPEEKGKKRLERFGGKLLNGLSLAGKMTGLGWSKGMPEDAGIYYDYYRKDVDAGYGAELRFSGAYIGDENEEVTVGDASIYKLEDFDKRGYGYSHVKNQQDLGLALDQVSPRYLSEIIYQLTKATASSTETNENWREDT